MTRDQFQPGTVFTTRNGCGNGNAVQTFIVKSAPTFDENYGAGQWRFTAQRWVKKTQKFSSQAYCYNADYIAEDAALVATPNMIGA
jgi:hypothetical protein